MMVKDNTKSAKEETQKTQRNIFNSFALLCSPDPRSTYSFALHSTRSATIGATFVARHAGNRQSYCPPDHRPQHIARLCSKYVCVLFFGYAKEMPLFP
jgi:hypothetical protein